MPYFSQQFEKWGSWLHHYATEEMKFSNQIGLLFLGNVWSGKGKDITASFEILFEIISVGTLEDVLF